MNQVYHTFCPSGRKFTAFLRGLGFSWYEQKAESILLTLLYKVNALHTLARNLIQLLDAKLYDLIILKGGPSCSKSTFMRRTTAAMEERELESVYIHCSGDPDSLDGVIFPAIGTAIVDGTAPHGMDTLGPGVLIYPALPAPAA